jgi:class 3 adenylate cyclase
MTEPLSDNNESVSRRNSRANLEHLLDALIDQPDQRADIERDIDGIFGQDKAVMALDMSGFSRTTHQYGIVPFLLMIHQMKLLAGPSIEAGRGLVLKAEADNLFALFDTVADAVLASREVIARLNAANTVLPDDRQLYISIGIGYGHILNIEDRDVFGDEVNLASKLGEDIADKGEVLLTTSARDQLGDATIELREESVSISGLALIYYRVLN